MQENLAGGPPLVGCPRLLTQCLRTYAHVFVIVSDVKLVITAHTTHEDVCESGGEVPRILNLETRCR